MHERRSRWAPSYGVEYVAQKPRVGLESIPVRREPSALRVFAATAALLIVMKALWHGAVILFCK